MKRMLWLREHLPARAWDNLATVSILAFCGVMGFAFWLIIHLNDQRINDIQAQRIYSCERTYEGVREVFLPFFPPPAHRSNRQERDLEKLNNVVDRLKRHCTRQVTTKP